MVVFFDNSYSIHIPTIFHSYSNNKFIFQSSSPVGIPYSMVVISDNSYSIHIPTRFHSDSNNIFIFHSHSNHIPFRFHTCFPCVSAPSRHLPGISPDFLQFAVSEATSSMFFGTFEIIRRVSECSGDPKQCCHGYLLLRNSKENVDFAPEMNYAGTRERNLKDNNNKNKWTRNMLVPERENLRALIKKSGRGIATAKENNKQHT